MSNPNPSAPAAAAPKQPSESSISQPPYAPSGTPPQRDLMGRFLPGNPGGQGNPFGRTMASRRTAIMSAVNEEKLMEIMLVMVGLALQGDVGAAKLVFQYAAGKPVPMVDPDRIELDEWDICRESVVKSDDMKMVREGVTAKVANLLTVMIRVLNETENVEAIGKEILGKRPEKAAKAAAEANGTTDGTVPGTARTPMQTDNNDRPAKSAPTPTPEPRPRAERPAPAPTAAPSHRAANTGGQAARDTKAKSSGATNGQPVPDTGANRPPAPTTAPSPHAAADFDPRSAEWLEILNRRPLDPSPADPAAAPSRRGSNGTHRPSKSRSNGPNPKPAKRAR